MWSGNSRLLDRGRQQRGHDPSEEVAKAGDDIQTLLRLWGDEKANGVGVIIVAVRRSVSRLGIARRVGRADPSSLASTADAEAPPMLGDTSPGSSRSGRGVLTLTETVGPRRAGSRQINRLCGI